MADSRGTPCPLLLLLLVPLPPSPGYVTPALLAQASEHPSSPVCLEPGKANKYTPTFPASRNLPNSATAPLRGLCNQGCEYFGRCHGHVAKRLELWLCNHAFHSSQYKISQMYDVFIYICVYFSKFCRIYFQDCHEENKI